MNVAFVDVETLGLDPLRHAIWEVAIIIDDEEHLFQINLSKAEIAAGDPIGMEIGRFNERYRAAIRRLSPFSAAYHIEYLLNDRHIVGAVPSFDEQRLALLCDRMLRGGLPPVGKRPWHYHLIDVEALAVGYLAERGVTTTLPWKSHELSEACGVVVPKEDEHTALGDARWAKRLYEQIVGMS